ncbi:MAG TPA: glycosyltransferase [Tepidisphaeraceae bacterium]|jgi:glycosyltransferase involved in cell wall biosynthesis|nr:glycosyltransferase [Tepidisphaeraceae bacterium]
MRILHVISTLDPATGGPPAVVTRLAAAQAALGHEVHVASYESPAVADRIAAYWKSIPHHELVRTHPLPMGARFERFTARAAGRELGKIIPAMNMVHLHGIWDPILKTAAGIAHSAAIPYAIAPHGMLDPWSMRQRLLKKRVALVLGYRNMLDHAAFLHVLNADEKDLLEPRHLHNRRKVIPNGVFLEELEPLPAKTAFHSAHPALEGKPYVLFLSRLHFKKGLDYLADAFALCAASHPVLQLVVAGPDDGAWADFHQRIDRVNLAPRVHVVGPLYGPAKLAALTGASCFCLPSRQEGFSMAIAEALACEIPVVISQACHFPEVAEVGAGHIVALNPKKIADAILEVMKNPQRAAEMGQAGRKLIESRFTWPAIGELSIRSYSAAISDSSTRR